MHLHMQEWLHIMSWSVLACGGCSMWRPSFTPLSFLSTRGKLSRDINTCSTWYQLSSVSSTINIVKSHMYHVSFMCITCTVIHISMPKLYKAKYKLNLHHIVPCHMYNHMFYFYSGVIYKEVLPVYLFFKCAWTNLWPI